MLRPLFVAVRRAFVRFGMVCGARNDEVILHGVVRSDLVVQTVKVKSAPHRQSTFGLLLLNSGVAAKIVQWDGLLDLEHGDEVYIVGRWKSAHRFLARDIEVVERAASAVRPRSAQKEIAWDLR